MSSKDTNLKMTPEQYAKRLWDWTPLNGCFDRGIRVGDLDGFVEVGNKFLVIEGKPPGGELPKGQGYALTRLAKMDNFTVVVLEGTPPFDIVGWRVLGKKKYVGGAEEFKKFIRKWFEYADAKGGEDDQT